MRAERPKSMIVAGVMSGTSADGVDVALARISPARTGPKVEVLGHRGFAYPPAVRRAVLAAMDAKVTSVAELSRLNWRLGEIYAECVDLTCRQLGVSLQGQTTGDASCAMPTLELIGMHGQTIYHQAAAAAYAGRRVRATWQMGEAAVMRERCGIPVVSDFRPADLAADGQAAPLVPMLDYCLFRSPGADRVLLNLGGIANLTVLRAGCSPAEVVAFDTGPANMVMDAVMERRFGKKFDRNGRIAARGRVVPNLVERVLREPYFIAAPPKSCGREEFGAAFVDRFERLCGGASAEDALATALELTVQSVAEACRRFAGDKVQVIAAGGGVRNTFLMQRLGEAFGERVATVEEWGLASQAKEAVAFALLAWLSWHGLPGNLPAATGARGQRVLGKISW